MLRNGIVLLGAFYLLLGMELSAQQAKFSFFNTKDGLEGNFTKHLAQDQQGFIWLLNQYVLYRYDGRTFVKYTNTPKDSLGNTILLRGLFPYNDSLLLVQGDYQLYYFNPLRDSWSLIDIPADDHTRFRWTVFFPIGPEDFALSALEENNHNKPALWRLQRGNLQEVRVPPPYEPEIGKYTWMVDPDEDYFIINDDTLRAFSADFEPFIEIPLKHDPMQKFYGQEIRISHAGELVFGFQAKIYAVDKAAKKLIPHPLNRFISGNEQGIEDILLRENGDIYICGEEKLFYHYNAQQDTVFRFDDDFQALFEVSTNLNSILFDNTQTLWIGSSLGLVHLVPQQKLFTTFLASPLEACRGFCSIRGITEDASGNIYANCYGGIFQIDSEQGALLKIYSPEHLPFDISYHRGDLFHNSGDRIDLSTGKEKTIEGSKFYHSDFGLLTHDASGRLWWAYESEVKYLDESREPPVWVAVDSLPYDGYQGIEAFDLGEKSQKIWIGLNGQLIAFDPEKQAFTYFEKEELGKEISRILAIHEDKTGRLWLGTDVGLLSFDPISKEKQHFTSDNGLPHNFVCGLLPEGDSCLWLSTNMGLSRFQKRQQAFINFFEEDGLLHNEFNRVSYFKGRDGRMYFGGLKGIIAFYPEKVMQDFRQRNAQAQLLLSAFERTDERAKRLIKDYHFPPGKEIHINHWHRSFTFEYVLTDYTNPDEIHYSFMLAGYEDNWSAPSRFNFARYSSLPHGSYTFRVKARDSKGQWHPSELRIPVIVHPPWWETAWAYALYVVIISGILLGVFLFFRRRLILRNQLQQEQQEASRLKELDHFKSKLYTNLTHEFRTPLTVILGMAKQLEGPKGNTLSDRKQGLRLIKRNSENLLRLINQLLDLSKLENKSFSLQLQQGDIIAYLRYLTSSFRSFAESKSLQLQFKSREASLIMDFDPEQIKQIVANLLSNAMKFTPEGGEVSLQCAVSSLQSKKSKLPTADLNLSTEKLPTAYCLLLTVSDTGIGIPKENLPYIFDRFYQVDGSRTRKGEGTGIGLAHTQELVKLMGGELTVESEVGKGTVFSISLPIHRDPALAGMETIPYEIDELPYSQTGPGPEGFVSNNSAGSGDLPTLLIVEDNRDIVAYLRSCLGDQYQLEVAFNGAEGISKALASIPDLIISDVMMPEKDGFELCETLKLDERTSHIPLILLTAKADAASRLAGIKRGADAYMAKPCDQEELLVQLAVLMERQKRLAAYFRQGLDPTAKESLPESDVEAVQLEHAFIQKVNAIIEANYADENFALPQLCEALAMSRSQLFRKMKALINTSPSPYLKSYRLNKAKGLLQSADITVSEAAWQVGFKEVAHFSKSFQTEFGYSPSEV